MQQYLVILFSLLAVVAADRTITVKNNCKYTIWPGVFTPPAANKAIPNVVTGWKAPPGHVKKFKVPEKWTSGRIWARTGCDFSKGALNCHTGACNGGLKCDKNTGTGVPPASLAEWSLGDLDWYDVSLVDGFNVPMKITPTGGCPVATCKTNLNPKCPNDIAKKVNGKKVGCLSACAANLDGHSANSTNCCSGSFNTPEKCPKSKVAHYDFFKKGCPRSYAYAYDEKSGNALFTCKKKPSYTLTFCPK
ncbi:Osmotin, thaumatin-like protein [Auriculariales sp. MPI-PUGE-AT-0066]|nr:Osmotin, thaumatin-like protein [Auriculariales sp. MPI-PUGE-AT-0066]